MATRAEKIAFIQSQMNVAGGSVPSQPSVQPPSKPLTREEKIEFIRSKMAEDTKAVAPQTEQSFGEKAMVFGLDALPTVGGIVGGILGTGAALPTGPGAIAAGAAGAGLGGAAGESYRQLGYRYLGKEAPRTSLEAAKDIAGEGAIAAGSQVLGNAIGIGGKAALATKPVQKAISAAGSGLAKVGEAMTGIPKKAIETYAKRAPEVAGIMKSAGDDLQVAADTIRAGWNKAISGTRKGLNQDLAEGLRKNADKVISKKPIVEALEAAKAKVNAKLSPEIISHIDDLIAKVGAVSDDAGQIALKDAHDLKVLFQNIASGAYNKGGQIFQTGREAAQAAKSGAALARKGINAEAAEVAASNNGLANLRGIERSMNRNLLKEGETAASIMGAGSGANPKNIASLRRLSQATGKDMIADAENLYAAKVFSDAPILAWDGTGKVAGRMAAGAGLGYLADGKEGAAVGMALTSPMALKGMIRAGRGVGNIAGMLSKGAAQNAAGKGVISALPEMNVPAVLRPAAESEPKKGPDKWVNDGFERLMEHADGETAQILRDNKSALMQSAQGRKLLMNASDLKPGSRALDKLINEVMGETDRARNINREGASIKAKDK